MQSKPLNLHGKYRRVQILLEWGRNPASTSQSDAWQLLRFIIFVQHPQRMLYGSRSTRGVLQDLHLAAGAKLAGVVIDEHFYETTHKPGTYGRLTSWQQKRQQSMNASAIREVSSCSLYSPASLLSDHDLSAPSEFADVKPSLRPPIAQFSTHQDEV